MLVVTIQRVSGSPSVSRWGVRWYATGLPARSDTGSLAGWQTFLRDHGG